jgi:hypothetical protein
VRRDKQDSCPQILTQNLVKHLLACAQRHQDFQHSDSGRVLPDLCNSFLAISRFSNDAERDSLRRSFDQGTHISVGSGYNRSHRL